MVSGGDVRGARVVAVLVALVLVFTGASALAASKAPAGPKPHKHKRACDAAQATKRANCHAEVVTADDGVTPLATMSPSPGAYTPADLRSAYALGAGSGAGTIAIVDAFDQPNAEADLGAYRSQFGLPACTTANGCFRKVNQTGAQGGYPRADIGWGQEISLDLDMASAICPGCRLLLVETNSNTLDDLFAGVDLAAGMGANAISNSYGASEFSSEASYENHFRRPGIAITVSSGDNGYRAEYPAASQYVTAVGGTHLVRASNGRGWSETAWSSAGSGCSAYITKPTWQKDTGCSKRTVADVSAIGDPNTGVAIYDSYGSGGANWFVFGGTSVAAPIIAGVYMLGGNTGSLIYGSMPYAHPGALNDVTSGSNGGCTTTYLCTAVAGYDGPTGLGTPAGLGAFGGADNSSATTTTTSSTTTTSTSTTTTTIPTTTTTSSTTTTTSAPTTTTTTAPPTTTTTAPPTTTTSPSTTVPVGAAPSAPNSFGAMQLGGRKGVYIYWGPPNSTGCSAVTGYRLYRASSPGTETYLATIPAGTVRYQDSATVSGARYYYQLTAVNSCGESPRTAEANAIAY